VFITKQTTLIHSSTTQAYFNLISYTYIYATRFGLYLDHPQARQYKNHTKEDTIKIQVTPFHSHCFMLEQKIYIIKL